VPVRKSSLLMRTVNARYQAWSKAYSLQGLQGFWEAGLARLYRITARLYRLTARLRKAVLEVICKAYRDIRLWELSIYRA
jgi:hypothetical protein